MKRVVIFAIMGLILSSTVSSGILGNYLKVKGSLETRKTSGSTLKHKTFTRNTSYTFIYYNYIVTISGSNIYESEIECPLDTYLGGVNLSLFGRLKGNLNWSLNLSYFTNFQDPTSPTLDSDWRKSLVTDFDEKYIYTESENTLKAKDIDVNLAFDFANKPKYSISGILGYMYQKFEFEAIGLDGWFLIYENDQYDSIYFQSHADTLVGINQFTYHIPYIALQSQLRVINPISINTNIGFSPLTYGRDYDNHVLRNKDGRGTCSGATFILSGNVEWPFWKRPKGSSLSLSLGYRYLSISTAGDQRQEFYGDDPGTPNIDETGRVTDGLDYDLNSTQKSLSFSVTGTF